MGNKYRRKNCKKLNFGSNKVKILHDKYTFKTLRFQESLPLSKRDTICNHSNNILRLTSPSLTFLFTKKVFFMFLRFPHLKFMKIKLR